MLVHATVGDHVLTQKGFEMKDSLTLFKRGTPEFNRWLISDQDRQFWTGAGWTESGDESKALLYSDLGEACREMQVCLTTDRVTAAPIRFCVPLCFDVWPKANADLKHIKKWLMRMTRIVLEIPPPGRYTVDAALGGTIIEWSQLEAIER